MRKDLNFSRYLHIILVSSYDKKCIHICLYMYHLQNSVYKALTHVSPWTKRPPFHWCIYLALGVNELINIIHCGLIVLSMWQRFGSTLAQVMACCLMAPSHYLNQCWLVIHDVLWHWHDSNFLGNTTSKWVWKYTSLKLLLHLPGANELILTAMLSRQNKIKTG